MESPTDSSIGDYDAIIRRTVSLFGEADFHKQVLKHLRHFRNRVVHAGEGTEEIETLLFQLRRYVQELITFHATNDLRFERFEEACEFLDLPILDITSIGRRLCSSEARIDFTMRPLNSRQTTSFTSKQKRQRFLENPCRC